VICIGCNKEYVRRGFFQKYCSYTCKRISRRYKNHIAVYNKHHCSVPKGWVIHHIDFSCDNNDINNLIALPRMFHRHVHDNNIKDRQEIERLIDLVNQNEFNQYLLK
jgi:hypothetical protein